MSIDLEAIEAQFNRATPVEFVALAGRYLPVLFMECKRQAEQLSSVTAERDAAVDFIRFLDMNYAGYIQDSDRFDEWRKKYGRSSKNED